MFGRALRLSALTLPGLPMQRPVSRLSEAPFALTQDLGNCFTIDKGRFADHTDGIVLAVGGRLGRTAPSTGCALIRNRFAVLVCGKIVYRMSATFTQMRAIGVDGTPIEVEGLTVERVRRSIIRVLDGTRLGA
jgi:hypothetical protein